MSTISSLPEVLTISDVADYLRVSRASVCRWCKTGQLNAFRIGRGWRIHRSSLEAHITYLVAEPLVQSTSVATEPVIVDQA